MGDGSGVYTLKKGVWTEIPAPKSRSRTPSPVSKKGATSPALKRSLSLKKAAPTKERRNSGSSAASTARTDSSSSSSSSSSSNSTARSVKSASKGAFPPLPSAPKAPGKLGSLLNAAGAVSRMAKDAKETKKTKNEVSEDNAPTSWFDEWKKWVSRIDLAGVVMDALELPRETEQAASEYMQSLTRERVEELLAQRSLSGLAEPIVAGLEAIRKQYAPSGSALAEQHKTTSKFQMGYGGLDDFFGGLEALLGPPQMAKDPETGEATILRAMEVEHCEEGDSHKEFTSSNGVTTTSAIEWEFVVRPDMAREQREALDENGEPTGETLGPYPERGGGFAEKHPEWCRRPRPREELGELLEKKANGKLREQFGESAVLITEEFLAAVLYTGPMFQKYNAVLRALTQNEFLVGLWRKQCGKNTYATTIHAIAAAVIKLSKLSKAGKVYRGVCYGGFPDKFWVADEMGVRGGIEFGFSSTTRERAQAVHYANGNDAPSGEAKTIMEMQMGMVRRPWHERPLLAPSSSPA